MTKDTYTLKQYAESAIRSALWPIVRLCRHVWCHLHSATKQPPKNVWRTILDRAIETSADYVEEHLATAMVFNDRKKLWNFAMTKVSHDGLFAEFGVFSGESINYFAKQIAPKNKTIFGFDSFEGLKEDWHGTQHIKGTFDLQGNLPPVLPNVKLIKGWFDSTVPSFIDQHRETFSFIHFDADTYESTMQLLNMIGARITKNTVLVFDEYIGFPNWKNGEYRAWQTYVKEHEIKYEYLGFATEQAAIKIL